MSKVLQERGFGSLPSSTKANPRDQVKSISTTIEADSYPIRRIRSSQYAVSTGQSRTLMYKTRQTMILFLSCLNGYYCEEKKGSYGPKFSKAYSEDSQSIPQKDKDPRSFTLPCFINNVCFDNALFDLGASVSVMPFWTYLNLGLGELAYTKLIVELADMTVKYPKGIAENVLVGIGK
ncbi:ATP-dependent DNA helicase PIF1-like protein, partial [Tanacetum coccineum]